MLRVNGKEVVYSRTFVIGRGETAVLTEPALPGFGLQFYSDEALANVQEKFKVEQVGEFAKFSFPFIEGTGLSFESKDFATSIVGKYSLRATAQGMGVTMLLHIDVYLDPTPA